MKRNRKHNMFGWLAASALLLTTACADNADLLQGGSTDATNVVTFTVQTNLQAGGTRSEAESHISDGTTVDVLVFAVYKKTTDAEGNETWKVAKEFGKGSQVSGFPATGTLPEGLNAIDFSNQKATIQLVVTSENEQEYKVAFWAQSSKCTAYTIDGDLTKVKVAYKDGENDYANNDETRDAFCGVSDDFTAEDKTVTQNGSEKILLRRPFAQVNVGTVGWDYESTAVLEPYVFYKDSYIELEGVADNYDVLTGKATVSSGSASPLTAKFEYAKIPAFHNVAEIKDNKWVGEDGKTVKYKIYEPFSNEEYLKVKLYGERKSDNNYSYEPYKPWNNEYLTMTSKNLNEVKTEMYKYLSMCYVLVPTATGQEDNSTGATLETVKFGFKGYTYNKSNDSFSETDGGEEFPIKAGKFEPFEVYNVPVQANWRTNILGNNFFLSNEKLDVWINQEYFGDYNDNAYDDGVLTGRWPHTIDFCNDLQTEMDDFFKLYNGDNAEPETTYTRTDLTGTSVYNGTNYTKGLKLGKDDTDDEAATDYSIQFTSKDELFITIVMSTVGNEKSASITLDDETLDGEDFNATTDEQNKNIRIYKKILPVPTLQEGQTHTIKGTNSPVVLFLSVVAREQNEEKKSEETTQQ